MRLPPWTRLKYIYKSTYNQRKKRENINTNKIHIYSNLFISKRKGREEGKWGGKIIRIFISPIIFLLFFLPWKLSVSSREFLANCLLTE